MLGRQPDETPRREELPRILTSADGTYCDPSDL